MADTIIGASLSLDSSEAITSMKQLKQSIKDANNELIAAQSTFGELSKEAVAAAKKVAALKDQLHDAKEVADLFDPGKKFQAMAGAVSAVAGGVSALTGAMNLLGLETDGVEKSLLKVQSALALSQGLSQVADSAKDFQRLGKVIVESLGKNGLIGIAIVGVVALGATVLGLFDNTKKLTEQQKMLNAVKEDAVKIYAKEKFELEQLIEPLNDETKSKKEKQAAIDKLQETYPGYFKNLSIEGGHVVGLKEDYDKLTKAMLASATARAATGLAEKELSKIIEDGAKIGITSVEQIEQLRKSDDIRAKYIVNSYDVAMAKISQYQKLAQDAMKSVKDLGGYDPNAKATVKKAGAKPEDDYVLSRIKDQGDVHISVENDITKKTREAYEERLAAQKEYAKNSAEIVGFGRDLSKSAADSIIEDQKRIGIERAAQLEQERIARDAKVQFARDIGGALGALADLIGKQTAAGKVLAIAQATINMWVGVTEVLRSKSVLPEPLATISKVVNIATVVATGLSAIKNIVKTQVPGAAGGAGSASGAIAGASAAAPLSLRAVQSGTTSLDQNSLNQLGNATGRTYVLESDIANNRERLTRLSRAARLSGT